MITKDQARRLRPGDRVLIQLDVNEVEPPLPARFRVWNNDQVILAQLDDGRRLGQTLRNVNLPEKTT